MQAGMTTSAPPRPASERATSDSKPLDRDEIEALVDALMEEARQETRRRHRRYWAAAALLAFVGVALFVLLEGGAASQTASPGVSARMSVAGQAGAARIAFTSTSLSTGNRNVPNPPPPVLIASELYVVNADGSDKRLLKRRELIGYPDAGRAVWSPDGQTIAYADYSRLFFVNADGSGQREVTRELGLRQLPIWSPDGRRILVAKCRGGQKCDIYVMNADGSGLRRLAPGAFPFWSPNGKKIAFLGADSAGWRNVATIRAGPPTAPRSPSSRTATAPSRSTL